MATVIDERALGGRLAGLEAARAWSPRIVSRLEALIRDGDDAALFRVNPFTLARQSGFHPAEFVALLLHPTAQGLFEMDWLLICPRCACAVESFAKLRAVMRQFRCPQCHNEYEAAMDDYIAIYFNISPQIAATRYQQPQALDPFDYTFHYRGVREGRRPDGALYIDSTRAALCGIEFVPPEGAASFGFTAAPGMVAGVSADTEAGFALQISGEPVTGTQPVRLAYRGDRYEPAEVPLAPGPVQLEIANPTSHRIAVAVVQFPPDAGDEFLTFDPYLTGKHLLTSQTFKSLFRSEVVGGAQGIAIRDIAILFTDIRGSTALYQRIGDLNAYELVQQHFDWLREATVRHGGAVVKTIGDAVMAAYPDAARAVGAALEMRRAVGRAGREQAVSLKIGVHHGAAIAVTLNEQLDYFGQTVNIAARVQALADAGEIWVTEEVWGYPGVRELLAPYPAERRTVELRGVERPLGVLRIGDLGEAAPA